MKTKKRSISDSILLILTIVLFSGSALSAADLQKTFTWKYSVDKDAKIVFQNYDCDIVIHTWDKGETEFRLSVNAKARNDDDSERLEHFLENLEFDHSASQVTFSGRFWKNRTSILRKITMSLPGEKDVVLSEFNMKGELWIPLSCAFYLSSKYSRIELEDFSGRLDLDLYNDNLYARDVKGMLRLNDKHSKIEFNSLKDVELNLYNSNLESTGMGNLEADSKYSKITTGIAGVIHINSYNDKYSFARTGDITFEAKYSDLVAESSENVKLNCYEGSVEISDLKDIDINSKYTDFLFGNAGKCRISSSYNGKLEASKIFSLDINESKYCTFEIDELLSSITEKTGYEDNFVISRTGSWFTGLNVNGKYIEISLGLPKTTEYHLLAKIKYPDLNIDESSMTTRIKILENSQLEYDGIKGKEKDGMPVIQLTGYEVKFKVNEL